MKYLFILMAVLAAITLFSACVKDNTNDFSEENEQQIVDFLADNNITATATGSGLYYRITRAGNGFQFPTASNTVSVYYEGYKLGGSTFDSRLAPETPISFPLQGVIAGWTEGIPLVSKGGIIQLFIPAHLAYGSAYPSDGGVIAFDVELLDFE